MGVVQTASNVTAVRGLYEAFAQGDLPRVIAGIDEKIEWREAEGSPFEPSGAVWTGPDAVVDNLFKRLATEWDGFAAHPQQYHDAGETVVVEGRYTGKYKATGADLDAQFCHVFTFKNDKIARFQQFTDTAQHQKVMGMGQPDTAAGRAAPPARPALLGRPLPHLPTAHRPRTTHPLPPT